MLIMLKESILGMIFYNGCSQMEKGQETSNNLFVLTIYRSSKSGKLYVAFISHILGSQLRISCASKMSLMRGKSLQNNRLQ